MTPVQNTTYRVYFRPDGSCPVVGTLPADLLRHGTWFLARGYPHDDNPCTYQRARPLGPLSGPIPGALGRSRTCSASAAGRTSNSTSPRPALGDKESPTRESHNALVVSPCSESGTKKTEDGNKKTSHCRWGNKSGKRDPSSLLLRLCDNNNTCRR